VFRAVPCMILKSPSSSEQGQLTRISLALPCTCHSPSVTAPTGQISIASSELHCHFCICVSGQTLTEKHGALVPGNIRHCPFIVHKQCVMQCAQIYSHTRAYTHVPSHAQLRGLIHTGALFCPYLCLIWVYTRVFPSMYTCHILHTHARQLSHLQALCTSCSKEHKVSSVFLC